ncbi:MAG: serine acetyltransferase [Plesiomonas shigelloides]
MSFWQELKAELALNQSKTAYLFLLSYRLWQTRHQGGWLMALPSLLLLKGFKLQCGLDISSRARIGWGLRLYHPQNIVIGDGVQIGRNCTLRHNCTLGNKLDRQSGQLLSPTVGDGVEFGTGAIVIGAITIGDHACVGAGSIVTRAVPVRAVVAGNPARIIREYHDAD